MKTKNKKKKQKTKAVGSVCDYCEIEVKKKYLACFALLASKWETYGNFWTLYSSIVDNKIEKKKEEEAMQCMHGAMYIHICNVCHVLLIVLSLHFLHKNQLFLHLFITSSSSSNKSICLSIFMDYSPPLSSPDSTPPPSPPPYIEEPKTLNEQQLNEFRVCFDIHMRNASVFLDVFWFIVVWLFLGEGYAYHQNSYSWRSYKDFFEGNIYMSVYMC